MGEEAIKSIPWPVDDDRRASVQQHLRSQLRNDPDVESIPVLASSITKFEKLAFDSSKDAVQYIRILTEGVGIVLESLGGRSVRGLILKKIVGDEGVNGVDALQTEIIVMFDRAAAQLLQKAAVQLISPIVELPIKK